MPKSNRKNSKKSISRRKTPKTINSTKNLKNKLIIKILKLDSQSYFYILTAVYLIIFVMQMTISSFYYKHKNQKSKKQAVAIRSLDSLIKETEAEIVKPNTNSSTPLEILRYKKKRQKMPRLPCLIIIGNRYCGTEIIQDYLSLHPYIVTSANREIHFFDEHLQNIKAGSIWYRNQFVPTTYEFCSIDRTDAYVQGKLSMVEAVKQLSPDSRILLAIGWWRLMLFLILISKNSKLQTFSTVRLHLHIR